MSPSTAERDRRAGVEQYVVIEERALCHLGQQQFAADVERDAGLCARHRRHVVQPGAAQVVGAAAVYGVRLGRQEFVRFWMRKSLLSEHDCDAHDGVDGGDLAGTGCGGDASNEVCR